MHPPIQKLLHAVDILCISYYEAFQRKNRANRWNDCHSRIECPDSKSGIKNLFGFRARDFQHSSLAPGRILFSYCGADPSRAKTRAVRAYVDCGARSCFFRYDRRSALAFRYDRSPPTPHSAAAVIPIPWGARRAPPFRKCHKMAPPHKPQEHIQLIQLGWVVPVTTCAIKGAAAQKFHPAERP